VTTTTTDQGLTLPSSSDGDNVPTSFGGYNTGVESRLVKRYTSAADRTARNPTPTEGELSYLVSTGAVELYDGSAWGHPFPNTARGIMAAPTTAGGDGTATSGTTEVRDDGLGVYQWTAEAGRYYVAYFSGGTLLSDAGDRNVLRIRNSGSSSTPTTASTLLGEKIIYTSETGIPGRNDALFFTAPFTAAAGTNTIATFYANVDSGVATPSSTRALWVQDIGPT
jgi:hypothetical protein